MTGGEAISFFVKFSLPAGLDAKPLALEKICATALFYIGGIIFVHPFSTLYQALLYKKTPLIVRREGFLKLDGMPWSPAFTLCKKCVLKKTGILEGLPLSFHYIILVAIAKIFQDYDFDKWSLAASGNPSLTLRLGFPFSRLSSFVTKIYVMENF